MTRQRGESRTWKCLGGWPISIRVTICGAPSTAASLYRAYQVVCAILFLFNRLGSIQISCSIGQIVCQVADPNLSLACTRRAWGFLLVPLYHANVLSLYLPRVRPVDGRLRYCATRLFLVHFDSMKYAVRGTIRPVPRSKLPILQMIIFCMLAVYPSFRAGKIEERAQPSFLRQGSNVLSS